jgi:hypothetical protein
MLVILSRQSRQERSVFIADKTRITRVRVSNTKVILLAQFKAPGILAERS